MIQAVKKGKQRFGNDPNFRPDLVPGYFVPRLVEGRDDLVILKRIIAAYKKAKVRQKSAGEAFNVSNEWLSVYERNLGLVMKSLLSENVAELQRMYQNFFRDPCSTGLVGLPINIPNLLSGGAIKQKFREYILCDVLHRYDLWKKRTGNKYTAAALSAPMVGNPYGYTMDGVFIRAGGDYHHYYAHAVAELVGSSEKRLVVELGGGFGGLAYYLVRDNPHVTYVDFDLPEATALASYYLMRSLPNVPIRLYGEAELSAEALATPGFVMMPSFEIIKMPSKSAAVSFNSYSLAEMSPATIHIYLDQVTRITSGYFLHVNHNRNAVLSADKFGIEERGFKLVNRELAGWTLGINPQSDEYEYLYKA
jgi:putative sugar O-methyltransferase